VSGSCVSLLLFCFAVAPQPQQAQTVSAEVHPDRTITFRLSAPKANEVTVAVNGLPAERLTRMEKDEKGMWSEPSVGFGSISAQNSDRAAFTRDRLEDVMPLAEKLYRISAMP